MNKRALLENKEKFRMLFLSGVGPEVLGLILQDQCRFFGPCNDEETAVRMTVGRELLSILDLWAGQGQTTSSRHFINKLARGSVETVHGRVHSKEKK